MKLKANNFPEYLKPFPKETQNRLKQIRELVIKLAPDAEELISYGMPAFKMNKRVLLYFAAYEFHIGFYPYPSALEAFKKDFANYKTGKGSVQFPLDEPLPIKLLEKLIKFRIQENLAKQKIKK